MSSKIFLWSLLVFMSIGGRHAFSFDACPWGHCTAWTDQTIDLCKQLWGNDYAKHSLELRRNESPGGKCVCPCSCVVAETRFSLRRGAVLASYLEKASEIYAPYSNLGFSVVEKVSRSSISKGQLQEVSFGNGSVLRVSPNHTFVTAARKITSAERLNVGEFVLDSSGQAVEVRGNRLVEGYSGNLYNLIVNEGSPNPADHIVVTNDIQSGDWLLQTTHDVLKREIDLRLGEVISLKDKKKQY